MGDPIQRGIQSAKDYRSRHAASVVHVHSDGPKLVPNPVLRHRGSENVSAKNTEVTSGKAVVEGSNRLYIPRRYLAVNLSRERHEGWGGRRQALWRLAMPDAKGRYIGGRWLTRFENLSFAATRRLRVVRRRCACRWNTHF